LPGPSPDDPGPSSRAPRRILTKHWLEHLEVAPIHRAVIPLRHSGRRRQTRFVDELRRGNRRTDAVRILQERFRLRRRPHPIRIARPRAHAERRHNLRVHRLGEARNALPLRPREHATKSRRSLRRCRRVAVLKINGVRPRSTDPQVCRTKRRRQLTQPRIRQVDRLPLLKQRRIDPWRSARGLRQILHRRTGIRPPETPTDDLHHLHVVGLEARIDLRDRLHRVRILLRQPRCRGCKPGGAMHRYPDLPHVHRPIPKPGEV
jgi:hypothetical protein